MDAATLLTNLLNQRKMLYAMEYGRRGKPIFPVHTPVFNKQWKLVSCSCGDPKCSNIGKHPRVNWKQAATTDLNQIQEWWKQWPDANIGMATGAPSGLDVIDADKRKNGPAALEELAAPHGGLPNTLFSHTGGGGEHYFVKHNGRKLRNRTGLRMGLDFKTDGGYVLLPPSTHQSGGTYEWPGEPELADILTCPLAELPTWFAEEVMRLFKEQQAKGLIPDVISEHSRHDTLVTLTGHLRRITRDTEAIFKFIWQINLDYCSPRLEEKEVRSIAESTEEWALHIPLTEAGNAERLVHRHGHEIRYVGEWKKWLVWDGSRWATDTTGLVYQMALSTVRAIAIEASAKQESRDQEAILKWAKASESKKVLQAMIDLASKFSAVAVKAEDFDTDKYLLNVQNGTLDLRNLQKRDARPEDLLTKQVPVPHFPDATCPLWDAFLEKVLPDASVREYFQRAMGYALTGDYSEQTGFICYGDGNNGKSTALNVPRRILGDYADEAAPGVFLATRFEKHPTGLADLASKRFITAIETGHGKKLDESLIKAWLGGDRQKGRFMAKDYFGFDPIGKLFIATNHKPRIIGQDEGIWRKLKLIPFTVTIEDGIRDPRLQEKLMDEAPGILNWMLAGLRAWYDNKGLGAPATVLSATSDYRTEQRLADPYSCFIEDCCVREASAPLMPTSTLWKAWQEWCLEMGRAGPGKQDEFIEAIYQMNIRHTRTKRARGWSGIRLKTHDEKYEAVSVG